MTRFKPGQSGNPKGRPTVGASIHEWLHVLAEENEDGTPKFTIDEIRALTEAPDSDRSVSAAKRAAAQQLLAMTKEGRRPATLESSSLEPSRTNTRQFGRKCTTHGADSHHDPCSRPTQTALTFYKNFVLRTLRGQISAGASRGPTADRHFHVFSWNR